jgi:chemotaxis protein MotB
MSSKPQEVSENWKTSFADLMSILLVFFVIQISPQAVKSEKQKEDKEKLEQAIVSIKDYLNKKKTKEDVVLNINGNQANITLPEAFLFSSASADLSYEQRIVLSGLINKLKPLIGSHYIEIEGHTDSLPINTEKFPSNWHLSSDRALEVLGVFIDLGFDQKHLSARGLGRFRPLLADKDEQGRDIPYAGGKNRRVSIEIKGLESFSFKR